MKENLREACRRTVQKVSISSSFPLQLVIVGRTGKLTSVKVSRLLSVDRPRSSFNSSTTDGRTSLGGPSDSRPGMLALAGGLFFRRSRIQQALQNDERSQTRRRTKRRTNSSVFSSIEPSAFVRPCSRPWGRFNWNHEKQTKRVINV